MKFVPPNEDFELGDFGELQISKHDKHFKNGVRKVRASGVLVLGGA